MTADKLYDEDEIYKDQMVQAYLEMYGEFRPELRGDVKICSNEAIVQRQQLSVKENAFSIALG